MSAKSREITRVTSFLRLNLYISIDTYKKRNFMWHQSKSVVSWPFSMTHKAQQQDTTMNIKWLKNYIQKVFCSPYLFEFAEDTVSSLWLFLSKSLLCFISISNQLRTTFYTLETNSNTLTVRETAANSCFLFTLPA